MGNIGIFLEIIEGNLKKINKEVMSLTTKTGKEVIAVTFSEEIDSHASALFGVSKVVKITGSATPYSPDKTAATMAEIIKKYELNDFVAGLTSLTRDLLPRVAAKLDGTVIHDCIELDLNERKATKPVYTGKLLQQYQANDSYNLFTIRGNIFPVDEAESSNPAIESFELIDVEERTVVKEILKSENELIDVADADIIVSGGRGMGSRDNFSLLFDLANSVNAAVGASRAAVDAEYADPNMQVGQTGKIVNPKLYLAFGISGAIQHFVGMKTSKVIVAVNKDADAPIFKKADYGIVGDLFKAIPLFKTELEKE